MTRNIAGRTVPLLAVLALMVAGCDASQVPGPEGPKRVATVAVSTPAQTLMVGEQITLVAKPKAADGQELQRAVIWTSQNELLASVSPAGVVTALAPGAVNIFASSEGHTGSAQLTVIPVPPPPPPPVAQVRLSVDEEVELEWNGSSQLGAVALDADGNELPGREIEWLTNKPSVVSVSQTGLLQAESTGTAIVSAEIEGVTSSVGVRVRQAPVVEVLLDTGSTALEVGETVFFGARLKTASGQILVGPVTWMSSAPDVATVTGAELSLGAVQALSVGSVTITASAEGVAASVTFRVTAKPTHDLIYHRGIGAQAEIFVLSLAGAATPVRLNAGNVSRDPSPSPNGTQFVFAVSQTDPLGNEQHDLFIVNRNGLNMRWLTRMAGFESQPAWSPDGTKVLFHGTDAAFANANLWVINIDGSGLTNLTATLSADITDKHHPSWSPDGSRIAFIAARGGSYKVWTMNADGSNAAPLTTDFGFDATPTWAPSGDRIAFTRYNTVVPANGWDIMIVPVSGGTPTRLSLPGDQLVPAWSPDGEYIAAAGTAIAGQGRQNLYTVRPDGTGLRLRTVNSDWGGGSAPAWIVRQ